MLVPSIAEAKQIVASLAHWPWLLLTPFSFLPALPVFLQEKVLETACGASWSVDDSCLPQLLTHCNLLNSAWKSGLGVGQVIPYHTINCEQTVLLESWYSVLVSAIDFNTKPSKRFYYPYYLPVARGKKQFLFTEPRSQHKLFCHSTNVVYQLL